MTVTGRSEVVVVGGGIAGCTVAWELARRGASVSLLERDHLAFGASGRNLGLLLNDLAPDSVGMMREVLPSYRELAEGGVGFDLREVSYLLLPVNEEQASVVVERVALLREAGLESEPAAESDLRRALPQLRTGVHGAQIVNGAWALTPASATRAFAEAARNAGASIETGVKVGQLSVRSGKVAGVVTDRGQIACDAVVLASGPWTTDFLELPLSTGRGWVLQIGRGISSLPWVLVDMSWPDLDELGRVARPPSLGEVAAGGYDRPAAATVSMVPQPDGRSLLGTSLAPSLRDAAEGLEMPRLIAQRALQLLPGFSDLRVAAGWFGMRPMTPDGLPIVGRTEVEGVYLHTGHGSIGMQSAPWTARGLAALIEGGDAPALVPFNVGRFKS